MKRDKGMWLAAAALAGLLKTEGVRAAEAVTNRAVEPAGVTADAAERAQRQQVAAALAAEAAKSQERLDAISQQLRSLDSDIESRVDRIVKLLSTIKDSTDSRGRVRRSKEKAIEGLKNSIAFYVRERDKRDQALVAPDANVAVSKEALAKDAKVLDTRIEKRIGQISALASSLTQNAEFNQYERYRNDEYDYNTETKEFHRFEKDVSGSAKIKAELIQDLKAGIDKQTREVEGLRQMLTATTDPKRQEQIKGQIEEKEELIADRRQQAEDLLSAHAPSTKPVSSKGAFEIDKLLAEMTLDLQSDFRKFQQLVSERNEAQKRAQIHQDRLQRFRASVPAAAQ
ncbi:MAG: hypothetical protein WCK89_06680 [bacterium]